MDPFPWHLYEEAQWFYYRRDYYKKERLYIRDHFVTCVPSDGPGHVNYSVWVQWKRGGAGWSRRLYHVELQNGTPLCRCCHEREGERIGPSWSRNYLCDACMTDPSETIEECRHGR